jgi:uncharacterized RDD family membrane protein YckC
MASVPNSGSAPPPPVWDARPPETAVRYAGFWVRVVAALVDAIALSIIWWIAELIFPEPLPPLPANPDLEALLGYLNSLTSPGKTVAYALLIWAYFALQESSSAQATVGKRLLGIRVSTEEGARLSLGAATVRTWPIYLPTLASLVGTLLGTMVGLIALVACVAVAFSDRKQGLHDKMAGALLTRR